MRVAFSERFFFAVTVNTVVSMLAHVLGVCLGLELPSLHFYQVALVWFRLGSSVSLQTHQLLVLVSFNPQMMVWNDISLLVGFSRPAWASWGPILKRNKTIIFLKNGFEMISRLPVLIVCLLDCMLMALLLWLNGLGIFLFSQKVLGISVLIPMLVTFTKNVSFQIQLVSSLTSHLPRL